MSILHRFFAKRASWVSEPTGKSSTQAGRDRGRVRTSRKKEQRRILCLGENEESWGLGWSGSSYNTWHNGSFVEILDIPKYTTIGVYLDQPAGVLNFYGVDEVKEGEENTGEKEVYILQQIRSPFEQKMIPGFWVGPQSHCSIKKKEE
ncbi:hypothetical protein KUCAC02_027469 [Chaenocephalus aceratus]|uniref:Uncharacterized protein n=1 Tax=Chaenocephalus aceratus TaxID=36190 RepID=A0ACB9W4Q0_CHAAC|nr:hypothetical protein KUCAC02_027469 [Chaenocephalus aceratus]